MRKWSLQDRIQLLLLLYSKVAYLCKIILLTKCRHDLHKTTALVTHMSYMEGSQSAFRYYLHQFQLLSDKTCESQVCNYLSNSKPFFSTFLSLFNIRHDTWCSIGTRGKAAASYHVLCALIQGNSVDITVQTPLLMSTTLMIGHQQTMRLLHPWLQPLHIVTTTI
jgi:hypothetical protein